MWNFSFVIPNIILLVTFLIFYFSQPHIPISKNRAFLRILFVEIATIIIDVIATACLENYSDYPIAFHLIVNVVYFVAFILRSVFFFHFTIAISSHKYQRKKREMLPAYSVFVFCLTLALMNLFVPTLFILDENGYHQGAFYNSIYLSAFFYVFISVACILSKRKNLSKSAFISALSFNMILFIGYVVRAFFPNYLVLDFFCLLSIIVIYLQFENSAIYTESRTGAFSHEALSLLLDEKVGKSETLALGILIYNYNDMREIYTGSQIDRGLRLIAESLKKMYPKLSLFYIYSGRFILIGSSADYKIEKIKEEIRNRFKKPWKCEENEMELYLDIRFVEASKDFKIKSSERFMNGIMSALNNIDIATDTDIVISEETFSVLEKNSRIKRAVRKAVENREVEMFLQPLVSAQTHEIIGAEALSRIRDADGALLPPTVFIPFAEKNGHINLLGEQMFEKACEFASTHDLDKMGISWINVNLSPLQFLRSDLTTRFSSILEHYGVSADKIHLEITEEAMIDYALLQKQIQNMKLKGFDFVLDDFGAGYSNVTRLRQYPFINIKLDMEVVWDYFKNREEILPALVRAFKNMGFSVTAEGIETKEMAKGMKDLGSDYLQGFYFSRPLSTQEFTKKYSKDKPPF